MFSCRKSLDDRSGSRLWKNLLIWFYAVLHINLHRVKPEDTSTKRHHTGLGVVYVVHWNCKSPGDGVRSGKGGRNDLTSRLRPEGLCTDIGLTSGFRPPLGRLGRMENPRSVSLTVREGTPLLRRETPSTVVTRNDHERNTIRPHLKGRVRDAPGPFRGVTPKLDSSLHTRFFRHQWSVREIHSGLPRTGRSRRRSD